MLDKPRFAALRVTGTGGEDDSDFLRNVNGILKTCNIHSAELDELSLVGDEDIRAQFIDLLCQSSIECLELFNLDPLITKGLLEKLPEMVRCLSISQNCGETTQQEPYRFLPAGNLTTLHLERCMIDLSQAAFPNLTKIILDRVSVAHENTTVALVEAIGGMLKLEYLGMYRCRMTSLGLLVVKLLQQSILKDVIFNDCNFSAQDGEQILEAIQDGKLDHIRTLWLFGHEDLRGLEQRFIELCIKQGIEHQISAETMFDIDNLIPSSIKSASERDPKELNEGYQQGVHDLTSLKTFVTDIIQNQVKESYHNYMTIVSNMTPERLQAITTPYLQRDPRRDAVCDDRLFQLDPRAGTGCDG